MTRLQRWLIVGLIAACGVVSGARGGHAMGMCGLRADFIRTLADQYQETGKALGIAGQVNLVEVFASKAGTWTILVTTPEGKSCIIAAGSSWEDLPIKPKEDDT